MNQFNEIQCLKILTLKFSICNVDEGHEPSGTPQRFHVEHSMVEFNENVHPTRATNARGRGGAAETNE